MPGHARIPCMYINKFTWKVTVIVKADSNKVNSYLTDKTLAYLCQFFILQAIKENTVVCYKLKKKIGQVWTTLQGPVSAVYFLNGAQQRYTALPTDQTLYFFL